MSMDTYWAVARGVNTGLFENRYDFQEAIRCPLPVFKVFENREEANQWLRSQNVAVEDDDDSSSLSCSSLSSTSICSSSSSLSSSLDDKQEQYEQEDQGMDITSMSVYIIKLLKVQQPKYYNV